MMDSGIYKITNSVTGKAYVGSAVNLGNRKQLHFHHLRHGTHKNKKLQASYNKHGESAFHFEEIERCAVFDLIEREQHWMDTLKAVECGYNLNPTAGSALGRKFPFKNLSETHRDRIGQSKVGKKRKPFTPEWRKKLSEVARRPRPSQSLAMKTSWSKRPTRRVTLSCSKCSKPKEYVISAAGQFGESYKCRPCYLEDRRQ